MLPRVLLGLATWGGVGFLPFCPGTWGTLAALPLWWLLASLGPLPYALVGALLVLGGIKVADAAQALLGRVDHPAIVIDEAAGLLVALAGVPPDWLWLGLGVILFRLADILKPWPIRPLCLGTSGLEVMLDDLLAGLMACVGLELLKVFLG